MQDSGKQQPLPAESCCGFTLIEVLSAVLLLALALFTMLRTVLAISSHTSYLQDKTRATWVALNVLNKMRGACLLPGAATTTKGTTVMYQQLWQWHAYLYPTPQLHVYAIAVQVRKFDATPSLSTLNSFLYLP